MAGDGDDPGLRNDRRSGWVVGRNHSGHTQLGLVLKDHEVNWMESYLTGCRRERPPVYHDFVRSIRKSM